MSVRFERFERFKPDPDQRVDARCFEAEAGGGDRARARRRNLIA
jgi:hypothetical protein